jgi:hypothetical protein
LLQTNTRKQPEQSLSSFTGDHFYEPGGATTRYMKLEGYAFSILSRELCLCQTSTMMLGKECLPYFPVSNGWNTDDEIVLAIGKHFPILHSGAYVSVYHIHDSQTKMSNNARNVFKGVSQLAIEHRDDIFCNHGTFYVLLWRLRVLKAFVGYQIAIADSRINRSTGSDIVRGLRRQHWRAYRKCLRYCHSALTWFLRKHFVLDYF